MKFDITIKDASAADLTAIANVLNGSVEVKPAPANAITKDVAPVEQPVTPEKPVLPNPPVNIAPKQESEDLSVDSTGMPWDERIHASTKATTKDGAWKKRRGVPELTVDQVEAELRGVAVDTSPAEQPQPQLPQFPAAPQVPAMPVMPQAPQAAARDFNSVLTRVQFGFQQGKMNAATVKEISDALNVASITDINGNQPLVDQAHTILDGYGV